MILKRYLFSFALLLCGFTGLAQENWGGGVDDENLHFGFTFQFVSSEFKIQKTDNWNSSTNPVSGDRLISISSPRTGGFSIGFVTDLRLGTHVNFRSTPALVFTDRYLDYTYENLPEPVTKQIQSANLDIPLGFKFKSDRRKNFRAYFIGGIVYSIDLISKKKINDENAAPIDKFVKNTRNNLMYEAGVGFDLYFEFFKLSPEIKVVNSFKNVLYRDPAPNDFNTPIDKLFLRNLKFSLYFE